MVRSDSTHNEHGLIEQQVIDSVRRALRRKYEQDGQICASLEELGQDAQIPPETVPLTLAAYGEAQKRRQYVALLDSLWQEIADIQEVMEGLHVYATLEDQVERSEQWADAIDYDTVWLNEVQSKEYQKRFPQVLHEATVNGLATQEKEEVDTEQVNTEDVSAPVQNGSKMIAKAHQQIAKALSESELLTQQLGKTAGQADTSVSDEGDADKEELAVDQVEMQDREFGGGKKKGKKGKKAKKDKKAAKNKASKNKKAKKKKKR